MYFIPILIVCSLNAGFLGDVDSGATCLKFFDRPEVHYLKLDDCAARLREMLDSVRGAADRLTIQLPGPWRYIGKCTVPVIDERGVV